jgi:uncharacterized protein (DUF433 family)
VEIKGMTSLVSHRADEPWRRRAYLPIYKISEAAQYAKIAPQTVAAWHGQDLLTAKDKGAELSYLQLIEVAVVAAFRKMGVSLKTIRATREYAQSTLKSEYPFAELRFKEEAKHLFLDSTQIDVKEGSVVQADQGGQLAWAHMIGRLREFDYEQNGIVLQWHVAGRGSPIIIDPRISFGAPAVNGVPTWVIKGRYDAGESNADIAEDFGIKRDEVKEALKFEGVLPRRRGKSRLN